MGKFRKKPVVIEAVQLTWKTLGEVCEFLGNIVNSNNPVRETTEFSDTCGEACRRAEYRRLYSFITAGVHGFRLACLT